jgi:hypothetical protein
LKKRTHFGGGSRIARITKRTAKVRGCGVVVQIEANQPLAGAEGFLKKRTHFRGGGTGLPGLQNELRRYEAAE